MCQISFGHRLIRSAENFAAFCWSNTRSDLIDTERRSDVTEKMLVRLFTMLAEIFSLAKIITTRPQKELVVQLE